MPLGAPYKSDNDLECYLGEASKMIGGVEEIISFKEWSVDFIEKTLLILPIYYLSLFTIPTSVANRI